jgi:hypothetical protein
MLEALRDKWYNVSMVRSEQALKSLIFSPNGEIIHASPNGSRALCGDRLEEPTFRLPRFGAGVVMYRVKPLSIEELVRDPLPGPTDFYRNEIRMTCCQRCYRMLQRMGYPEIIEQDKI